MQTCLFYHPLKLVRNEKKFEKTTNIETGETPGKPIIKTPNFASPIGKTQEYV